MELFNALGLNVKILIAQLINFAVLLFVLHRFAYKPILKFLDERKKKIEQGVDNAQKAINKLEEVEKREKEVMAKAKKEARQIIEQAKEQADKRRDQIVNKAKEEVGQIINQEKANVQAEKAKTLKEIKKEVADLVVLTVERVLERKVDSKEDKKLIERMIKK